MSVCVYICVCLYICVCVCVCLSSHACVFLCMCVFVCVCACASVGVFACISILMCGFAFTHACLRVIVLFMGQTSSLSSVRLHVQSSPCSADSHFLRRLTAVHVNNNICSAFIYLQTMFSIALLLKTEMRNLFFIFEFLKSTVERMNERILQLISPPRKLKGNVRWCVFPAVDGN